MCQANCTTGPSTDQYGIEIRLESWQRTANITGKNDEHFVGGGSDGRWHCCAGSRQQLKRTRGIAVVNANNVHIIVGKKYFERQGDDVVNWPADDPTNTRHVVINIRIVRRRDCSTGRCQHRARRVFGVESSIQIVDRIGSQDD